jgi:hypothetical protein
MSKAQNPICLVTSSDSIRVAILSIVLASIINQFPAEGSAVSIDDEFRVARHLCRFRATPDAEATMPIYDSSAKNA